MNKEEIRKNYINEAAYLIFDKLEDFYTEQFSEIIHEYINDEDFKECFADKEDVKWIDDGYAGFYYAVKEKVGEKFMTE